MEQTGKFSNGRAALGLLALVILAAAQLGAQLLASLPLMVGAPVWLGNVLAGVLYAALGVAGLLLLCGKGLRVTPEECRFAPVRLRPVWAASAVLMPALAAGALLCQPGHWQAGSAEDATAVAAGAVFFFGAGTGIVEEAVFRGVLMTAVERRWNKTAAVLGPSLAFALLHVLGRELSFAGILQLLAAGTAVGLLFSLVAYESGTVWCGAAMHAVWNMVMIGGVLHIGDLKHGKAVAVQLALAHKGVPAVFLALFMRHKRVGQYAVSHDRAAFLPEDTVRNIPKIRGVAPLAPVVHVRLVRAACRENTVQRSGNAV